VLTVALVGCGDTVSLDPVAKAAEVSSKQASEHMSITASTTVGGRVVSFSGEGDFQNRPELGSLTMSVPGQATDVVVIQSGTKMYMTSDAFRGQLPDGKSWLAMDMEKIRKTLGVSSPSMSSQSPTDMLAALRAAGDQVTKVGPETIDGIATTHYTAVVDPARAAKVNSALGTAIGETVTYQPIDVWIDSEGLVQRMHIAYAMTGSALPSSVNDMTMTFSSYGESVNVKVPPSWETYDATSAAASVFKP
jgi:hypothetical protein